MTGPSARHVLITGGSRGIGAAIARELAADSHVLVGGRSEASVAEVVDSLPSAEPFVADLADEAATAAAASRLTRLDALVHSAGVAGGDPVAATTRERMRAIFELNVFAVVDLTRLLLPLLRESPTGDVVTINSGAGLMTGAGGTLYNGSKHALRVFTDALREEERGAVRVTSIHPGRVDTGMQRDLQQQLGRPYEPSEHIRPESVARSVRLALDITREAQIESLTIRPIFRG